MTNPTEVETVKAKIENGDVKVKEKGKRKSAKAETKPKPEKSKVAVKDEQVLAWMREQGDKQINSTAIRDAFTLPNRATARRIMRALQKEGKVRIVAKGGNGKRKQFTYEVVA